MTTIRLTDIRLILLYSLFLAEVFIASSLAETITPSANDMAAAKEVLEESKVALQTINNDKLKSFVAEVQNNKVKIAVSEVAELAGSKKVCKKGCTSFLENSEAVKSGAPEEPNLILFVSWSMGKEAIISLGKQVQQVGGRLVFRGLINNSFIETQKTLLYLKQEHDLGVTIDIDPPLFEELSITQVPTFVVQAKDKHDRMSGSMSLQAAIEIMADEGETQAAKDFKHELMWGRQ